MNGRSASFNRLRRADRRWPLRPTTCRSLMQSDRRLIGHCRHSILVDREAGSGRSSAIRISVTAKAPLKKIQSPLQSISCAGTRLVSAGNHYRRLRPRRSRCRSTVDHEGHGRPAASRRCARRWRQWGGPAHRPRRRASTAARILETNSSREMTLDLPVPRLAQFLAGLPRTAAFTSAAIGFRHRAGYTHHSHSRSRQ